MNNQPILFERIIRGNLRPWLDCNKHDEKFLQIIRVLKPYEHEAQSLYEIDFYRCFNSKTKYYHKLIINEADNYCKQMIGLIGSSDDICIVKYSLCRTLKKLKMFLREAANLIKAKDYELKYINPYQSNFDAGRDHTANTYIIQLLKTALLKIYLEIQEVFKSHLSYEDYMEIEDLYLQVLSEPIPAETFLKRHSIPEVVPAEVKLDIAETAKVIRAHTIPESFRFDRLGTNPGALNDLFDSLLLHLFIAQRSSIRDFKKIFSGKEITGPIRWTGNSSEFYWFIYLIYNKYKFVEDLKQQQWKVACHCFVQGNGAHFDVSKIRNLKKPRLTAAVIEKAVKLLK